MQIFVDMYMYNQACKKPFYIIRDLSLITFNYKLPRNNNINYNNVNINP